MIWNILAFGGTFVAGGAAVAWLANRKPEWFARVTKLVEAGTVAAEEQLKK